MSADLTLFGSTGDSSPFDSIRHVRPDGSEFWSARELMPLLDYLRWERFADAVDRAKASANAAGLTNVDSEFRRIAQLRGAGNLGDQERIDFELSRYAAYLVAMNGDVRKPRIAAAQAYFAVRTREAETASARRQIPSHAESLRGWAAEVEAREMAERRAALAETKVFELEPKAAQADHFRQADGLYAIAQFCNDLALHAREKYGVKLLHEGIRDFLGEIGMVIRSKSIRRNEPTAAAIKSGWMRPKHTSIERSTGPQDRVSARLTTKGWSHAWDAAVRRLAVHGSLAPVKSIERSA